MSIIFYLGLFKFFIQEFLAIKVSSTTFFFCVFFSIDSFIVSIDHQLSDFFFYAFCCSLDTSVIAY